MWPTGGHSARGPFTSALVLTRGDDVIVARDDTELKALLGPIDSPAKVFLLLATTRYSPQCQGEWIRATADTFEVSATQMISDCPMTHAELKLGIARDGTIIERYRNVVTGTGCAGRRPAGLLAAATRGISAVGRYFAAIAHLEAASITAFERLHGELRAFGAPRELQRAAVRARADEVRHAHAMTRLAARYGASVDAVRVRPMPARSMREFAIENAREGCVRETWGALEAAFQARASTDPTVRRVYRAIAADELRHAALSWQIASWVEQRLNVRELGAVRAARRRAVTNLSRELLERRDSDLEHTAGLPVWPTAQRLLASLRDSLWTA